MRAYWKNLQTAPVIPVVWDEQSFAQLARVPVAFVYLQQGSIFNLEANCRRIKESHPNAKVFFHVDFAQGIAADETGVKFVHDCGVDGIVTTRPTLIEAGKSLGLETVLRAFIQDSRSVKRTIQLGQRCRPDGLDILPGPVLPEVIGELSKSLPQPIIGCGLIRREEQVHELLRAGCRAISTSSQELWTFNGKLAAAKR